MDPLVGPVLPDGAVEKYAVIERDGDAETVAVRDDRLRWPDTMSEGPDGTMYVTASHIQDSALVQPRC